MDVLAASAHAGRWKFHKGRADAYLQAGQSDADWAIVMRFYAALHLTEAYFCTKAQRFRTGDHTSRWNAIKDARELGQPFRAAYKLLRELSEDVRYSEQYVAPPGAFSDSARGLLTVESFLVPKLKTAGVPVI